MYSKKIFDDERGWKGDVTYFWLDCSKLKDAGWSLKYKNSKDAVIHTCSEYIKMNTADSYNSKLLEIIRFRIGLLRGRSFIRPHLPMIVAVNIISPIA
jgi:hypothetical protein